MVHTNRSYNANFRSYYTCSIQSAAESGFENNKFVLQIREHMDAKSALGDEVLSRLEKI